MTLQLPPIYPITDKILAGKATHLAILKELVRGGARLVQIRDKETPARALLEDLRRCVDFAIRNSVTLIVNDRADLVLSSGAAGVHLGQDDIPPGAARRILGPKRIIGLSTHSLADLRRAQRMPVDYLGFGPIYGTSTKQIDFPPVGTRLLRRACTEASKPVVAIGGIGLGEVREVLEAGATSIAIISALMKARRIAPQMEAFLKQARGRE